MIDQFVSSFHYGISTSELILLKGIQTFLPNDRRKTSKVFCYRGCNNVGARSGIGIFTSLSHLIKV